MKKLYFITIGFFVTLMVCFMIIGSIKEYPSQYCISHVEMQRVEIEDSYGEKSKDSSLTNYYILSIVLDNAKIKKTISDCQPYDEGIADPVKSLDILDKQGHNMNEQLRCVQIINGFSYAEVSFDSYYRCTATEALQYVPEIINHLSEKSGQKMHNYSVLLACNKADIPQNGTLHLGKGKVNFKVKNAPIRLSVNGLTIKGASFHIN